MEEEERIRNFLSGNMTEAEKQSFIREMEINEELKASVDHSRMISNIVNKDRALFSEAVKEVIHQERKKQSPSVYWIAASVSLLIAALAMFLWQQSTPSLTELADSYLTPHNDMLSNRSGNTVNIDLSDYNNGDYPLAAKSLQAQLDSQYHEVTALYLGVSYLLTEQPLKANDILGRIDKRKVVFSDDVSWYQSLALIKLNRLEEAESLLTQLVEDDTIYRERAIELLSNM